MKYQQHKNNFFDIFFTIGLESISSNISLISSAFIRSNVPLFLAVATSTFHEQLDLLTIGMVNDMYAESNNDEYKGYAQISTQKDFDAF